MLIRFIVLCLLTAAVALAEQTTGSVMNSSSPTSSSPNAGSVSTTQVPPALDSLQTSASHTATDIAHMRIEKWKADGETKRQAQGNADSIQRNLTSALPGLIEGVRSAPQDANAAFKLYRNLNALYDVLASLTESAGAFGPRSEFEELTQQMQIMDSARRNLADALERLTASTQAELTQLRNQIRAQQQQIAPPASPKKVVVDENAPTQKTSHKKKKPATSSSGGTESNATGSDSSSAVPPKP